MSKKITSRDLLNYQPLDTLNPENLREICDKLVIVEINKGDNIFIQSSDGNITINAPAGQEYISIILTQDISQITL